MSYIKSENKDRVYVEDVSRLEEKVFLVNEVFTLLKEAYRNVKGGLHFQDADELLSTTSLWRVIYLQETMVGVVVYKAKKGLKMVALGIANLDRKLDKAIKHMLGYLFRITFQNTWMEVSEGAEKFLMKIGGERFMVPNSYATALTGKKILSLDTDGYHYYREINGIVKRKIILGTIRDERKRC